MGIIMKFSLETLVGYLLVIRATNETGKFTRFRITDIAVVMSRILQEKEEIHNISKNFFKALIADDLLEYNSRDVAFLVC